MESLAVAHADFVHLRVHTAYSLSEGAIQVEDAVKLANRAGGIKVGKFGTAVVTPQELFGRG